MDKINEKEISFTIKDASELNLASRFVSQRKRFKSDGSKHNHEKSKTLTKLHVHI